MGKSRRRKRTFSDEKAEMEREERVLEQMRRCGREPTPKPGYFHDTDGRKRRRKVRLRDLDKYIGEE